MLFILGACNLSGEPANEQNPDIPVTDRWTKDRVFLSPARAANGADAGLLPDKTKSILRIEKTLKYGEYVWNDKNIGPGKLLVRVDLRTQLISVFRGKHEIGTAVILFGAKGNDTPIGTFPVKAKSRDHHSRTYDAPMPFSLWLTDDGVAVHGSEVRWGAGTHGCVGVPLGFAGKLFQQAEVGDTIEILRSPRQEPSSTSL
ncbi:hypothetical protein MNBD_ALPHA04-1006 [hydrothermal vent metagenome]|uniref:L,D-TPase catalytic domain-containing protein n=1 Tax=hydrothermal vent metagenome TaxID=652676 RepID=A0A3B0SED4_9ZZZZ